MGLDIYFNGVAGTEEENRPTIDGKAVQWQEVAIARARGWHELVDYIECEFSPEGRNFDFDSEMLTQILEAIESGEIEAGCSGLDAAGIESFKEDLRDGIEWMGKGKTYRFCSFTYSC
jgi:hypothetical protein